MQRSYSVKNNKRSILVAVFFIFVIFTFSACSQESTVEGYQQIPQDEAKSMMESEEDLIIVDVRTEPEYKSGHIPGAICIPVESINDNPPAELPNKDQTILIYCRSGRRSKTAAEKLSTMGYTNIYEFGGINDWTGDVVKEEAAKD